MVHIYFYVMATLKDIPGLYNMIRNDLLGALASIGCKPVESHWVMRVYIQEMFTLTYIDWNLTNFIFFDRMKFTTQ